MKKIGLILSAAAVVLFVGDGSAMKKSRYGGFDFKARTQEQSVKHVQELKARQAPVQKKVEEVKKDKGEDESVKKSDNSSVSSTSSSSSSPSSSSSSKISAIAQNPTPKEKGKRKGNENVKGGGNSSVSSLSAPGSSPASSSPLSKEGGKGGKIKKEGINEEEEKEGEELIETVDLLTAQKAVKDMQKAFDDCLAVRIDLLQKLRNKSIEGTEVQKKLDESYDALEEAENAFEEVMDGVSKKDKLKLNTLTIDSRVLQDRDDVEWFKKLGLKLEVK